MGTLVWLSWWWHIDLCGCSFAHKFVFTRFCVALFDAQLFLPISLVPYFCLEHLDSLGDHSYLKVKSKQNFYVLALAISLCLSLFRSLCVSIYFSLSFSLILFPFPELALHSLLLNPRLGWTQVVTGVGLGETGCLVHAVMLQDLGQLPCLPGLGACFLDFVTCHNEIELEKPFGPPPAFCWYLEKGSQSASISGLTAWLWEIQRAWRAPFPLAFPAPKCLLVPKKILQFNSANLYGSSFSLPGKRHCLWEGQQRDSSLGEKIIPREDWFPWGLESTRALGAQKELKREWMNEVEKRGIQGSLGSLKADVASFTLFTPVCPGHTKENPHAFLKWEDRGLLSPLPDMHSESH